MKTTAGGIADLGNTGSSASTIWLRQSRWVVYKGGLYDGPDLSAG
jgi:hypothetical protein